MSATARDPQRTAERRSVLDSFADALRRETHVLAHAPELSWQQLYNRLQWSDEPVIRMLALELEHRAAADTRLWFRRRTRPRESPALRHNLAGHVGGVWAGRFVGDGRLCVSAGGDGTLKVWEVATGGERATLSDQGGEYGPIVVTPVDLGAGPMVRCPACRCEMPLEGSWLDQVLACTGPGCGKRLRVNPFIVGPPVPPEPPDERRGFSPFRAFRQRRRETVALFEGVTSVEELRETRRAIVRVREGERQRRRGSYSAALTAFREALSIFRELDNRLGEAATLEWLGTVYSELGWTADAQEHFEAAAEIGRALEESS